MPGLWEVLEYQAGADKKSLYPCGICEDVFDNFDLRQEHLFNHQQSGMSKDTWTKNTMMRGLLTHASVANAWNLFAIQNIPHLDTQSLSWNWSDGRAVNAMEALEYKRYGNDQQLRDILNDVLATLNAVNEPVINVNSNAAFMQELQMFNQVPSADHDFGFDWGFN
ncbi:hypothetical protein BFW01_g4989 [Lasiodiplodia theobromae]|nr:hypothetical protein BFW01_g4989 [Lasiodiplodia theobromae]